MKKVMKKSLSVFLSILMVLTSCIIGLTGITAVATGDPQVKPGTVTTSATATKLVVPEQIYLYPDGASFRATTHTPFQFYVNDASDGSIPESSTGVDSTGHIYTALPSTASNATLNVRAYGYDKTSNAFTRKAGTVTVAGTDLDGNGAGVAVSSSMDITDGMSPDLASSEDGYYLLWELSYTDSVADVSVPKKVYNITYVYKPYTVPVAAGALAVTNEHENSIITWMSGFNGIQQNNGALVDGDLTNTSKNKLDGAATYGHRYGKMHYDGDAENNFGFSGFISSGNVGYINSVSHTAGSTEKISTGIAKNSWDNSTTVDGDVRTVLFADAAPTGGAYFKKGSNQNCGYYIDGQDGTNLFPVNNYTSTQYKEAHRVTVTAMCESTALINIDTSRYSNLKDIPNLAVGLTVTSDASCDDNTGKWYVADMTTGVNNATKALAAHGNNCSGKDERAGGDGNWYQHGTIFAGQKTEQSDWDHRKKDGAGTTEGVRYAGCYPRSIIASTTGTQDYYVKGCAGNTKTKGLFYHYAMTSGEIKLTATQEDKSALRTAIYNAINKMGRLGVNGIDGSGLITSAYFGDDASYGWTGTDKFAEAFRDAILALTTLDNSKVNKTVDDAASDLTDAVDALKTKVTFDAGNGTWQDSSVANIQWRDGKLDQEQITAPGVTAPAGYTFTGWARNNGTNAGTTTFNRGYNETFTAIYTPNPYTIRFINTNADNVSALPATMDVTYTQAVSALTTLPTRTGYSFKGYFNGGTKVFAGDKDTTPGAYLLTNGNYNVVGDTSVTTDWEANSYNITFNSNGGTPVGAFSQVYDQPVTHTAPSSKTGYTFNGFKFGNTTYFDNQGSYVFDKYTLAQNTEFTADFTAIPYTVTLSNGTQVDGTPIADTEITVDFDTTPSIPSNKLGNKTGSSLEGYYYGDVMYFNGQGVWQNPEGHTTWFAPEGRTLTARYAALPYTLSIDPDNGTSYDDVQYNFGANIAPIVSPSKDGYTFDYWENQDGTQAHFNTGVAWNYTSDVSIKAKYTPNTYHFYVFNDNGSQKEDIPVQFNSNTVSSFSVEQKTGYTLLGYYTDVTDESTKLFDAQGHYVGGTYTTVGNTNVYPKFDADDCTVQFSVDGAIIPGYTVTVKYDTRLGADAPVIAPIQATPASPNHHEAIVRYEANGQTITGSIQQYLVQGDVVITCIRGDAPHAMITQADDRQSTCTVEGLRHEKCECGYEISEPRALREHNYVDSGNYTAANAATPATCTTLGTYYGVCSYADCGASARDNGNQTHTDSPLTYTGGRYGNHAFGETNASADHSTKLAKCDDPTATYYRYCPNCGKYADEDDFNGEQHLNEKYTVTESNAHHFVTAAQANVAKVANSNKTFHCNEDVEYYYYCNSCGKYAYEAYGITDASTYTYTDGTKGTEHTFTAATNPMHKATPDTRTCVSGTTYYDYCADCQHYADELGELNKKTNDNDPYSSTDPDPAHHTAYVVDQPYVAPQVGAVGKTLGWHCNACGGSVTSDDIDALGEDYDGSDDETHYVDGNGDPLPGAHLKTAANCASGAVFYKYDVSSNTWADDNRDFNETITIGQPNPNNHVQDATKDTQIPDQHDDICTRASYDACTKCGTCQMYYWADAQGVVTTDPNPKNYHVPYNHDQKVAYGEVVATDCQHENISAGIHCNRCGQDLTTPTHTNTYGPHDFRVYAADYQYKHEASAANCMSPAMYDRVCYICHATDTDTSTRFPLGTKNGHNHIGAAVPSPAVEARCNQEGFTAGTRCSSCGDPIDGCVSLGTVDHSYRVKTAAKAPTCCTAGTTAVEECIWGCGTERGGDTVAPTGNHVRKTERVFATTGNCATGDQGYTGDVVCETCYQAYLAGTITRTQIHVYESGTYSAAPKHDWRTLRQENADCEHGTILHQECSICHTPNDKELNDCPGHKWADADLLEMKAAANCQHPAQYYKKCDTCHRWANNPNFNGKYLDTQYFENGELGDHVVGTPATCANQAICAVCHNQYGGLDYTNHVGNKVMNGDAVKYTCTTDGKTESSYCDKCLHVWDASTVVAAHHTDSDNNGICDICGAVTKDHRHVDDDGDTICDICKQPTEAHKHTDANNDTICDTCGGATDAHTHTDSNGDGICDTCHKDIRVSLDNCGCICHLEFDSNHFVAVVGKVLFHIARLFWRLFRIRKWCECGRMHY